MDAGSLSRPETGRFATHVLVEFSSMEDLSLPIKASARIKYCTIAVSERYVALGTNTGAVYIFNRPNLKCLHMITASEKDCTVTLLAFSQDDNLLAYATRGRQVLVVELNLDNRKKTGRVRSVVDHKVADITSLCWGNHGNALFFGDDLGKVTLIHIASSKPMELFRLSSEVILRLESSIVQLDTFADKLLVSTQKRTYMSDTHRQQFSPIGKKSRDGRYGSCFYHVIGMENPVIYCARPGSRLWEVDHRGEVLNTHQFKHLLNIPPLPLVITSDKDYGGPLTETCGPQSLAFPKLLRFGYQFLLSHTPKGVYVLNPASVEVVLWNNQLINFLDVICDKMDLFSLHSGNIVRKLTLSPIPKLVARLVNDKSWKLCSDLCLTFYQSLLTDPRYLSSVSDMVAKLVAAVFDLGLTDACDRLTKLCEELKHKENVMKSSSSGEVTDEIQRKSTATNYEVLQSGIYVVKSQRLSADCLVSSPNRNAITDRISNGRHSQCYTQHIDTDSDSKSQCLVLKEMHLSERMTDSCLKITTTDVTDCGHDMLPNKTTPMSTPSSVHDSNYDSENSRSFETKEIQGGSGFASTFQALALDSSGYHEPGDTPEHAWEMSHRRDANGLSRHQSYESLFSYGHSSVHSQDSTNLSISSSELMFPFSKLDPEPVYKKTFGVGKRRIKKKRAKLIDLDCDVRVDLDTSPQDGRHLVVQDGRQTLHRSRSYNEQLQKLGLADEFLHVDYRHTVSNSAPPAFPECISVKALRKDGMFSSTPSLSFTLANDVNSIEVGTIKTRSSTSCKSTNNMNRLPVDQGLADSLTSNTDERGGNDGGCHSNVKNSLLTFNSWDLESSSLALRTNLEREEISENVEKKIQLLSDWVLHLNIAIYNLYSSKPVCADGLLHQNTEDRSEKRKENLSVSEDNDVMSDISSKHSVLQYDSSSDIEESGHGSKRPVVVVVDGAGGCSVCTRHSQVATDNDCKTDLLQTMTDHNINRNINLNRTDYTINHNQTCSCTDNPIDYTQKTWFGESKEQSCHNSSHAGMATHTDSAPTTSGYSTDTHSVRNSNEDGISILPICLNPAEFCYDSFQLTSELHSTLIELVTCCLEYKIHGDICKYFSFTQSVDDKVAFSSDTETNINLIRQQNLSNSSFPDVDLIKHSCVEYATSEELSARSSDSGVNNTQRNVLAKEVPTCVKDTQSLDKTLAVFIKMHFNILDKQRIHSSILRSKGHRRYRWTAFVECLENSMDNESAVGETLQSLEREKPTDSFNLLAYIRKLYKADGLRTLHLCVQNFDKLSPLDVVYTCQQNAGDLTKHLIYYFTTFLENRRLSISRVEAMQELCCDEEISATFLECLLSEGANLDSLQCVCGYPRPLAHKAAWTHRRLLDAVLGLPICWEAGRILTRSYGYWKGYLRLLVQMKLNREELAALVIQLGDADLLSPSSYIGYFPKRREEWNLLFDYKRQQNVCRSDCSSREPVSPEGQCSSVHCLKCGLPLLPSGCNSRPEINSDSSYIRSRGYSPANETASPVDVIRTAVHENTESSHQNSAPSQAGNLDCSTKNSDKPVLTNVKPMTANPDSPPLFTSNPGDGTFKSSRLKSEDSVTIKWEQLARRLLHGVGAMAAVELLRTRNIPDGCLSFRFYEEIVKQMVLEINRRAIIGSLVERVDEHMSSQGTDKKKKVTP